MFTPWEELSQIKQTLIEAGLEPEMGEVAMVASTTVPVDKNGAEKILDMIDALEDLDDVQNVYTNVEISEEVFASLS